ncbi:aldehyde dehydrogenase family protein [Saccharopolyspora sp. ID03-671]
MDKVSFTGSTEVGRTVAQQAGHRLAHTSLELGGKNPSIVFPDAVNDDLIDGLLLATRFHRQGQSCTSGSRLLVHADVHDEVLDRLVKKLGDLVVGNPLDEASDIGAIINETQFCGVRDYIVDGTEQPGVNLALGGLPPTDGPLSEGFYHVPTVFDAVEPNWRISREEIFGPVLVVTPWRDVDEAIRLANDTNFGLAAFVWSHDLDRALNTAHRVEAGWVQVNQGGGQVIGQSYGGVKQSGMGREASLEGMLEGFTQTKQINVKLSA